MECMQVNKFKQTGTTGRMSNADEAITNNDILEPINMHRNYANAVRQSLIKTQFQITAAR